MAWSLSLVMVGMVMVARSLSDKIVDVTEILPSTLALIEGRSSSSVFLGDFEPVRTPSISFPDTWLVCYYAGI